MNGEGLAYEFSINSITSTVAAPVPIRQAHGTRVALSSGDVFWVDGLSPERVKDLLGTRAWLEFPSGRLVRTAQIAQLSPGFIPSTEPSESLLEE